MVLGLSAIDSSSTSELRINSAEDYGNEWDGCVLANTKSVTFHQHFKMGRKTFRVLVLYSKCFDSL
jgi:hypothetical protein